MAAEVPVLIVGGGPVGMLAGVLLARQGIASLAVERRAECQRAPAAHVLNARSFEVCRAVGVDAKALAAAASDPNDAGFAIWVTNLAGPEVGRLPFERQGDECLRFTPTPLRNLSQHQLEPILLETLRGAPGAELRYAQQWEGCEQDGDGVTSEIRDLATGELHEVRSRYLIAADGAGSRVRKALGIGMQGPARLRSFLMIHFHANLRSLVGERPGVLYWLLDPEAGETLVAHDIERDWVLMRGYDPDAESEDAYDEARCRELVRRAIGSDVVPFEIAHRATWAMSAQVAERFRSGRIFLAGDAAHRFPPTGGLGLNSGIQDVHGLAWKLAAALHGWASPELLETYSEERLPVARENADQSLRNASKLIQVPQALGTLEDPARERMQATLADPVGRRRVEAAIAEQAEHFDMLGLQLGYAYEHGAVVPDGTPLPQAANPVREYLPSSRPGARMPHAWLERGGERISSLDLLRPDGFTLVSAAGVPEWEAAAGAISGVPLSHVAIGAGIRDPDEHWAEVCGIGPRGALLVRPDQHVAWRVQQPGPDAAAALRGVLERLLGAPPARPDAADSVPVPT